MNHLLSFFRRLYVLFVCPGAAHYVAGVPSLPPPLTPEQEKALLARMMAGDRAARDDLITHNLRLVVYLAKKLSSIRADLIKASPYPVEQPATISTPSGSFV